MINNPRQILKTLVDKVNQFLFSNGAVTIIDGASEKAQKKLLNIRIVASEKYGAIVKKVNHSMIVQDITNGTVQPSPIPRRLVNWWQWYEKLTGLDRIEIAKQEVMMVQNTLFKCQEERRLLHRQASVINDKLKDVYGELVQTKRDDPKYVQLTIMENKGLQEQTRINGQLLLLENEERDHFTRLATAIKEYHDTQALNAQKYKYLSILASAILAILSLTGSMVYNNKRIMDVRNVIAEAHIENEGLITKCFDSLENSFNSKFSQLLQKIDDERGGTRMYSPNADALAIATAETSTTRQLYVYAGVAFLAYCILKTVT